MDYLTRDDAPFSEELWNDIDHAVVGAVKETLVARRFLPLYGPLGDGIMAVRIDNPGGEEVHEDGFAVISNRTAKQLPMMYEDFWLYWRDLSANERMHTPVDLGPAKQAAQALALREDRVVFYGVPSLGIDGMLTVTGTQSLKRSDWSKGEGAFQDVAAGIAALLEKGRIGRHTLLVSQDLWVDLQRIQGGTGVLESNRIGKLLDGRLYFSPILKPKTALLVCAQNQYIDLAVGIDYSTMYSEMDENHNHHLRIMQTFLPRIKAPDAIVVYK
ncbi:bacteriocin family protein [Ruminococcaceae bacterium OttesenSCG-928-I18]|nr:bacteriocin family protein [Ruminococcaceae bacterium OttesenSCG-928-I18]